MAPSTPNLRMDNEHGAAYDYLERCLLFPFTKTGHVISITSLQDCQNKIKTCQKAPILDCL